MNPFSIAFQSLFQPKTLERSLAGKPKQRKRLIWLTLAAGLGWFAIWFAITYQFYHFFFRNVTAPSDSYEKAIVLLITIAVVYLSSILLTLGFGGFFKRDNVLSIISGTLWSIIISVITALGTLLLSRGVIRGVYDSDYRRVIATTGYISETTAVSLLFLASLAVVFCILITAYGKTRGIKATSCVIAAGSLILAGFMAIHNNFALGQYLVKDEQGNAYMLVINSKPRLSFRSIWLDVVSDYEERGRNYDIKLINLKTQEQQTFDADTLGREADEFGEPFLGGLIPATGVFQFPAAHESELRQLQVDVDYLKRLEGKPLTSLSADEFRQASKDIRLPLTRFAKITIILGGRSFEPQDSQAGWWRFRDYESELQLSSGRTLRIDNRYRADELEAYKPAAPGARTLAWKVALGERDWLQVFNDTKNNLVIITSAGGAKALNADTGTTRWDISNHSSYKSYASRISGSNSAYFDGTLYLLSPAGYLFSIDTATGAVNFTAPVFADRVRFLAAKVIVLVTLYYTALFTLTMAVGLYRIPVWILECIWQPVCLILVSRRGAHARVGIIPLFFDHISTLPLPYSKRLIRRLAAADKEKAASLLIYLLENTNQKKAVISFLEEFFEQNPDLLFQNVYVLIRPDKRPLLDALISTRAQGSLSKLLRSINDLLPPFSPTARTLESHVAVLRDYAGRKYRYAEGVFHAHDAFSKLAKMGQLEDIARANDVLSEVLNINEGEVLNLPLVNIFGVMSELASDIQNYDVVDNSRDKQYYLSEARIKLYEISRKAQEELIDPERAIVLDIVEKWQGIITRETKSMRGPAQLELALLNKTLYASDDWKTVQVSVKNVGQSPAENIRVSLLENENMQVMEDVKKIRLLGTTESVTVEHLVLPKGNPDELRMFFTATFDDFERKNKMQPAADVVKMSSSTQEFKKIPNPYVVGTPLQSDKVFFGRKNVIEFVTNNLSGGVQNNVLIFFGQRRVGKSSILYRLMSSSLKADYLFVYIDCHGFGDADTAKLLYRICREIHASATKNSILLKRPDLQRFKENTFLELDDYLDTVESDLGDKKLVLMFDEYESLESKVKDGSVSAEIFHKLRNLMQHRNKKLAFIFVGTHRLTELTESYWSFLFNTALYHEIGPLGEKESRALITDPIKGYLRYDDLAVEKILRVTGLHPYFIQVTCRLIINYCNEHNVSYITLTEVNEVLKAAVEGSTAHVKYLYSDYANTAEREVLVFLSRVTDETKLFASVTELARFAADNQFVTNRNQIVEAIAGLKNKKLVREDGQARGDLFAFEYEFLRIWIEAHVKIQNGILNAI